MKKLVGVALVVSAVGALGCRGGGGAPWFEGSFAEARAVAEANDTLVMVEFFTDWCSWCRRLESETFADDEVRRELGRLVPMRVNAENGGAELARQYGVDGYPTIVFVDGGGDEVDRIVGYLPPDRFLEELRRIGGGDTFAASMTRLRRDPADWAALQRAVEGLLERSDPETAIAKIEAYHGAAGKQADPSSRIMLGQARAVLQERLYRRAAKLFQQGWDEPLRVPETAAAPRLAALVQDPSVLESREVLARRLREARTADARALFEGIDLAQLPPELLLEAGGFAYRSGNYELAGELLVRWYRHDGARTTPDALNAIAWDLYLMGRELGTALEMAREAYAGDPSPGVADTLGRLLYVTGSTEEALEVQSRAATEAVNGFAEQYRKVVELMRAGEPLRDVPDFELYPWGRGGARRPGEEASAVTL